MIKLILFVFLGALIHLGFKLKQAIQKDDFSIKVFIKNNLIGSILGLIVGITCILLKDDIFNMFGLMINNFNAVFIGYTGDSAFKQLIKKNKTRFKSKLDD